jgi:hypothetical protein
MISVVSASLFIRIVLVKTVFLHVMSWNTDTFWWEQLLLSVTQQYMDMEDDNKILIN